MTGAPIVQAKYDRLKEIAGRFGHLADEVTADRVRMRRASERLIHGGWEGKGVHSFSNEMTNDLLPGMKRLSVALREAQNVTLQLSAMLQQAEEEAAAVYNDNLGAVALGGGAAGAAGGGGGAAGRGGASRFARAAVARSKKRRKGSSWRQVRVARLHRLTRSYRKFRDLYRKAVKAGDKKRMKIHGDRAREYTRRRGIVHDRILAYDQARSQGISVRGSIERGSKKNPVAGGGRNKARLSGAFGVGKNVKIGSHKWGPFAAEVFTGGGGSVGKDGIDLNAYTLRFKVKIGGVHVGTVTGPSIGVGGGPEGARVDVALLSASTPPIKINLPGSRHIELVATGVIGGGFGFKNGRLSVPGATFDVRIVKDEKGKDNGSYAYAGPAHPKIPSNVA